MGRITESHAIWIIIAVVAGAVALWANAIGIKVSFGGGFVLAFCAVCGLHVLYVTVRPHKRLAALTAAGAQLAAFTAAAGLFVYLTATSRFPLMDNRLARMDAAIGFDWLALFNWLQNHPRLDFVLTLAYESFFIQICILFVVLSFSGQLGRIREFIWLWVFTLTIIILLSWVMPAEGAWSHYGVAHLVDAYHLPHFNGLRNGTMKEVVLDQTAGLITFPSFHAAMAIILIYTARGIPVLFPVYVVVNSLMILSTPTVGGHHVIDIVAGIAVVLIVVAMLRVSYGIQFAKPKSAESA